MPIIDASRTAGTRRWRTLRRGGALLGFGAAALLLLGGHERQAHALALPSLTYTVDTISDGVVHHQIGVVGVPSPVDTNSDGQIDVDVTASLVNLSGISITSASDLTNVVGANLTITRDPLSVLDPRPSPSLRILVHFSVLDVPTLRPVNRLGFGYDTGPGGNIPAHFQASLNGLFTAFNPLHAQVDTTGGLIGLTTNRTPTYTGPLSLLADFGLPTSDHTDVEARYQPFPGQVDVDYTTDATGNHVHYTQTPTAPTRLHATVLNAAADGSVVKASADVDQLPNDLSADFDIGGSAGSFDLTKRATPGTTDARFTFSRHGADGHDAQVNGAISGLPDGVHAEWSTGERPRAQFATTGAAIGGIDLRARNFLDAPALITPFVPSEEQYLTAQSVDGTSGNETEVTAHLEGLRHADLTSFGDTTLAHAGIGDGRKPLGVYARIDSRVSGGALIAGSARIAPLPDEIGLKLATAGGDSPIYLTTDLSRPADITAHAQYATGTGSGCGAPHSLCGDISLTNAPTHVDLRAGNLDVYGQGLDLDSTRPAGTPSTDIVADTVVGPGTIDVPVNHTTPLVAHLDLSAVPAQLSARFHTDSSGQPNAAEFHACAWNFTTSTCRSTPGTLGSVAFDARDFTDDARPASIDAPLPTTPQYLHLIARQASADDPLLFEAAGRLRDVSELNLRMREGVVGVRASAGGGDLGAHIDIAVPGTTLALDSSIRPLPSTFQFCVRPGGSDPAVHTGAAFTVPCENADPFSDGASVTPTTFDFDASQNFALTASVHTSGPDDHNVQHTRAATLSMSVVPQHLHVDARPATTCAAAATSCPPTRVRYDIPTGSPAVSMTLSGQDAVGDAVCGDPRATATATCVSAELVNLPVQGDLCYDATALLQCDSVHNLVLQNGAPSGGARFDVRDLNLQSVAPDPAGGQRAIVVRGDLTGVPAQVKAIFDGQSFAVHAAPPLQALDADVRNYIAPSLIDATIPAQRYGLPAAQSVIAAFGRGKQMAITAHIEDISDAAFAPSVTADGTPLGTQRVTVGFGPGENVRAYADIVSAADGSHLIADATVVHNPAQLELCFRGPDPGARSALDPVWCDTGAPSPATRGAVQVSQLGGGPLADVHAFLRQAARGNTAIMNAAVDITGVPAIVRTSFGNGTYDVAGLDTDGVTPLGIGDLKVDVASFDLPSAESGYDSAPYPDFVPVHSTSGLFPVADLGGAYLNAAATDSAFQARGDLGSTGAHVQHVSFSDSPCGKPDPNRTDYPYYPLRSNIAYTCVRADFTKDPGVGATPLALGADLRTGGSRFTLHDAGLTDVPAWLQATIARAPTVDADGNLMRRCGAQVQGRFLIVETNDGDGNCMPPMLRFDLATQPAPPVLFGSAEIASSNARSAVELANIGGQDPIPALLDAAGNPIDLDAAPATDWGADTGVRLKLGQFPQSDGTSDTVLRAGLRLPLPGSFTLDGLQSYSDSGPEVSTGTGDPQPSYAMTDLRAHFVARDYRIDPHGAVEDSLGNLEALMVTFADDGLTPTQTIQAQNIQDGAHGGPLPGEIGLDTYIRKSAEVDPRDGTRLLQKTLYQLDLRLSRSIGLALRMTSSDGLVGAITPRVENIPAIPADSLPDYRCNILGCTPGARIRAEIVSGSDQLLPAPDPPPPGSPTASITGLNLHVADMTLNLDFHPDPSGPETRRLDAVIHLDGAHNGFEFNGFASVTPGDSTPAKFSAIGRVFFDKFGWRDLHYGRFDVPVLGPADLYLGLGATLEINFAAGDPGGTSHVRVLQNVTRLQVFTEDGPTRVGPINLDVSGPHGFLVADIEWGPSTYGTAEYDRTREPGPLQEYWHECGTDHEGDGVPLSSVTVMAGHTLNRSIEPIKDPRINFYFEVLSVPEPIGDFAGIASSAAGSAFCGMPVATDLRDAGYPSDPVSYPGHVVPGTVGDLFHTIHPVFAAAGAVPDPVTPPVTLIPPDTAPPLSALIAIPSGATGDPGDPDQPLIVLVAVDDPAGSGVASITYNVDGGPTLSYFGPFRLGPGSHEVRWAARDHAGNLEATQSQSFTVDDLRPTVRVTGPAPNARGWYRSEPTFTVDGDDLNSDNDVGSGLDKTVVSLDGGTATAVVGAQTVHILEGVHTLVAYTTDGVGHRSAMTVRTIRVDLTGPTSDLRTTPPAAAVAGWWRMSPAVYARSVDGGSGIDRVEVSVDGSAFVTYTQELDLSDGIHTVVVRGVDVAGNVGPAYTRTVKVDGTSPTALATAPAPAIWTPLLGPARLQWQVGDNLSGSVRVQVVVLTATGDVARRIDAGTVNVTPRTLTSGYTLWDGRDQSLTGRLPAGTYTYQVIAVDEAGNAVQSKDSTALVKVL